MKLNRTPEEKKAGKQGYKTAIGDARKLISEMIAAVRTLPKDDRPNALKVLGILKEGLPIKS